MIPEGLHDHGAHLEDLGHVLPSNHHVPVVKLHVHLRVLIEHIVSSSCWGQAYELPVVTVELVASWSLPSPRETPQMSPFCPWRRGGEVNLTTA